MRLFTLSIAILVACGWFAFRYYNAVQQRQAVGTLTDIDAQVIYENQAKRMGRMTIPASQPPGPKWLHPILGVDFFDPVAFVNGDFDFSDAHVQHLLRLRGLRSFQAEGSLLTDKGIERLSDIPTLQLLNVSGSKITDAGTAYFEKLPKLQVLQLWNTGITDESVTHLAKLTNLKSLYLGDSLISSEAIEKLKTALPNCEIQWSKREPTPEKPAPIDAKHSELLQQLINEVMTCDSLKSTLECYGPETIDHIMLDSTSIPWPEKFESKSDTVEFRHLRTYRESQSYSKKLRKSSSESLCIRIDKFDLNSEPKLFDGPITVVIYNRGGNTIGGCHANFSAVQKDGKWVVRFQSLTD